MQAVSNLACPSCGRAHDERALVCGLCGTVLQKERASSAAVPSAAPRDDGEHERAPVARFDARGAPSTELASTDREPWLYLAIGLVSAPIFGLTPILQYMGWFLASLVHEMGHSAFAWLCGMPAFPAISLEGHAAAVHSEQIVVLALAIAAGLAFAAWRWLDGRARYVTIGLVAVLYPAIAFTGVKDVLHLLAGHGGELVFATLCLWKALHGGFTQSRAERGLYGTLGWYLVGKNALLCWGLLRSSAARVEYYNSGSFGMTNDYIRVAEDVLGWRLESVALAMLFAVLLVLPAAIALWRSTGAVSASDVELD